MKIITQTNAISTDPEQQPHLPRRFLALRVELVCQLHKGVIVPEDQLVRSNRHEGLVLAHRQPERDHLLDEVTERVGLGAQRLHRDRAVSSQFIELLELTTYQQWYVGDGQFRTLVHGQLRDEPQDLLVLERNCAVVVEFYVYFLHVFPGMKV